MNTIFLPLPLRFFKITLKITAILLLTGCAKISAFLMPGSPGEDEAGRKATASTSMSKNAEIRSDSSIIRETLNYFSQINQFSDEELKKERQNVERQFKKNPTVENRLRLVTITGLSPRHAEIEKALKQLDDFSEKELDNDPLLKAYVFLLYSQLKQQMQQSKLQMQLQESRMQQVKLQTELQQTNAQKAQLESKLEALKTIDAQFSSRPALTPPSGTP